MVLHPAASGESAVVSGVEFLTLRRLSDEYPLRVAPPSGGLSSCCNSRMFSHGGVRRCLPGRTCGTMVSTVRGNAPVGHRVTSLVTGNVGD